MRKIALLTPVLLAGGLSAQAQEMTVSGRLLNATGQPLQGISVVVQETNRGTTTDVQGRFSIQAVRGQHLVFSGVGFTTQEKVVDGTSLDISLSETSNALNDVVVVGYGRQKRANLTGAVVTLNNEVLTKRQTASTSNLLQGLAPGLSIQQQSGKPGAEGGAIRIRGVSSVFASNSPLIIVDGVASSLENIDPNAIENITVLKDAAAASIYGARATNGVILVTTKRGTGKGITLSYNNFISTQEATALPERVSAIDHMLLTNVAEQNRTGNPNAFLFAPALIDKYRTTAPNDLDVFNTNWIDLLFRSGSILQNHNFQVNAGGEKIRMFASGTFLDQQGLVPNSGFRKYDVRINPDWVVSDKLTVSGVLGYTSTRTINPSTGSAEFIIRQAIGLPSNVPGRFANGLYGNAGQTNNRNPLVMAEAAGSSVTENNQLLTRLGFTYRPVKGLEVEAFWAREFWQPRGKTQVKNTDIYQPNLVTGGYDKSGVWPGNTSLSESYSTNQRTTYLAQASYGRNFGKHSTKLLVGGQTEEFKSSFIGASRTGFINPDQPFISLGTANINNSGGGSEYALAGFYGRLNYAFDDRYLFEVNGRYDGTSRFSAALDRQWGFFPSASAGWVLSRERFFENATKLISFAKIRGSIGALGNQTLSDPYPYSSQFEALTSGATTNGSNTFFNNVNTLGLALNVAPNPLITWETAKQWNVGADVNIGKSWTVTADYFVRRAEDILFGVPIAQFMGLGNPLVNVGTMENRGWELQLTYRKSFGKLGLSATGMISDVKNKMIALAPGVPFLAEGAQRTQVGEALRSYFGLQTMGYFQDSAEIKAAPTQFGLGWNPSPTAGLKPGDVRYRDISGPDGKPDGVVNDLDRTFLGNNLPRYEYSININLTYGLFDLNLFGQGVGMRNNFLNGTAAIPFQSSDFTGSLLEFQKDYWTPENRNATFPRLLPQGSSGLNFQNSDLLIRNAAYFRLKNVNLGFRFPERWNRAIGIKNARVFVGGSNLITITPSWKGFDPEVNSPNGEFYPLMRTYTAGVNVNF